MNKHCLKLLYFLVLIANLCFSQRETEKWYISGPAALDFSSGVPVSLNNNGIILSWEGCSTISDATGNLLFYKHGNWLYNRNHIVTPNGAGLNGCNTVTQVAVFVPKPGSTTLYYLFIIGGPAANSSNRPWSLYYSEIDITLNGGFGDIAIKNMPVAASSGNCGEKMAVTKHCNGVDYWLLVHDITGANYKSYLI